MDRKPSPSDRFKIDKSGSKLLPYGVFMERTGWFGIKYWSEVDRFATIADAISTMKAIIAAGYGEPTKPD